jgi:hypothetical protein
VETEIQSTSPGGRYVVRIEPWEARNSHWVCSPELVDTQTGQSVFKFAAEAWSADSSAWESESLVRLALRKYPGGQPRGSLVVKIDCVLGTVEVDTGERVALQDLEGVLDKALQTP